jgi:hypothetical protein
MSNCGGHSSFQALGCTDIYCSLNALEPSYPDDILRNRCRFQTIGISGRLIWLRQTEDFPPQFMPSPLYCGDPNPLWSFRAASDLYPHQTAAICRVEDLARTRDDLLFGSHLPRNQHCITEKLAVRCPSAADPVAWLTCGGVVTIGLGLGLAIKWAAAHLRKLVWNNLDPSRHRPAG